WVPNPTTRGTASITYTCLVTISLCVYTAVHLNIPAKGTTAFGNSIRKAKWVVIGIFAPQLAVCTALVQLRAAVYFRREMQRLL
ncbi:hypothetical protein B0H66DRAFT_452238, partial [Apodospora peruviana]